MKTAYQHPTTGKIEVIEHAWLAMLLLNFIFPLAKGAWKALAITLGVTLITGFIGWFILPFVADKMMRDSFIDRGWVEVPVPPKEQAEDSIMNYLPWALFGLGALLFLIPQALIWWLG